MINTIEQALQPLFLAAFIFGFGILRYPFNHPRVCFSIFYMLTVWSVYAYVFHYVVIFFSPKSIFIGTLNYFVVIINMLVTIISIIITFCKYKKFRICIRKLDFVDNTLELLGTPKEYRKMHNSIKWIFMIWFIMISMTWFIDSLSYIERHHDTRAIIIPIIKYYPLHINNFTDIMYMFLLRYIGKRFDKINDHIEELSATEEYGLRCTWKKSILVTRYVRGTENRKRKLWIAMHLHLELCRIARDINGLLETYMTLQMLSYFIIAVVMLYFEYHIMLCLKQMYSGDLDGRKLSLIVSKNMWFVISLTKLISFNHICESISAKAKKTREVIHKLTNHICFAEAREEICQFVLQISLRPLKFSALGLFHFGYDFVRKFFIWILTAVVFMLQMDTSPISQKIIFDRNVTCYD